jgi:hypothetical protein
MKTLSTLFAFATFALVATPALATPPDVPPAGEDVCDGEEGRAKGLCTAYCEAMDCDEDPNASATACNKVKNNFTSLTGRAELPCEVVECPCAAYDLWQYAYAEDVFGLGCESNEVATVGYWAAGGYSNYGYFGAGYGEGDQLICAAIDFNSYQIMSLPVTEEQFDACVAEVELWAASEDLVCE